MSWRTKDNLGLDLVCQVHDLLRVDDTFVSEESNGFIYWSSDLAQHIWTDMGVYHNAQTVYRLHAETDLLRGRGQPQKYETLIEQEMDQSSFSAVIYDAELDVFRLHTSIFAIEENVPWLKKLFFAAVALQNAEAHRIAPKLAAALHGVAATSSHPLRGLRPSPDPNLKDVYNFFCPQGKLPSKWIGAPEWQGMEQTMEREADSFVSDHRSCLKATFPWSSGPKPDMRIVLEVDSDEPHAELGNGLHFTLTVPLKMSPEHTARIALELNLLERTEWKRCQMLGSWCCHGPLLAFRCFVPNTLYNPQILPELAMSFAVRAHWTDDFFLQKRMQAEHAAVSAPPAVG